VSDMSEDDEDRKTRRRARVKAANYSVGYCKPPQEHQFKPGHGRKFRARAKRPQPYRDILAEIGSEKVTFMDGRGRKRKLTIDKAIAVILKNKALSGDQKAIAQWIKERNQWAPAIHTSRDGEDASDCARFVREKIERMAQNAEQERLATKLKTDGEN
jgi:hypothetical protein